MDTIFIAIGFCLAFLLLVILAVVLTRTFGMTSKQVKVEPVIDIEVDGKEAAEHLAQAIKFKTISFEESTPFDKEPFIGFHNSLERTFPKAHSTLTKEIINDFSLLYTWEGQNKKLKPMLLMAHMDVVPLEPGTEKDWTYPAFEGRVSDGFIWGRGTMDDKASLLGIFEAVEWLLKKGFRPQRTIYLAFGHDEEVGGERGASRMAALLHSRNVELEYILDEGLVITQGMIPSVSKAVAMVGVSEKGYLSLELTTESEGGHSSIPPINTAIGILSTAIHRLESNQMPTKIEGPARPMFASIAPDAKFLMRMVFANQWLFGRLMKRKMALSAGTNAVLRTTTAATVFEAGVKENVLPKKAKAIVNFRIIPGESIDQVVKHVRKTVKDPRIRIRTLKKIINDPTPVSDTKSLNYDLLQRTIRQVFPGVLVAPGLVVGAADTRHYIKLSKDSYRFVPLKLSPEDLSRLHGTDERVSVENYKEIIKFYIQLIRNSQL
jgi:carboxypeptidase PM20D1